ncbi:MAG: tRNA lysidine(34) synthetase TilS [Alphaproteobacteria bacterium]
MAEALTADEFGALMAALGPFERGPRLAVAVSGGADSMALCLLAHAWARTQGGRIAALTVDHGLRPESSAEARRLRAWLEPLGISHHILRWQGAGKRERPAANLQALARAARYKLLSGWCRERHVLHLLLAHHLEDQAETFLLRLGRGSGIDGLAAMAPVAELEGVRLLRPLLAVAKERLRFFLQAGGQDWIEDPSNRDPAHARVRIRALLPALAREGMDARRLAATVSRMSRARAALEEAAAKLLSGAATVYPAGYCRLETAPLGAAPAEVGLRALARTLMCVAGAPYPPRLERLERLYGALTRGGLATARTLAGCRIAPVRPGAAAGVVWVCREAAAVAPSVSVAAGERVRWDGRFLVELAPEDKPRGKDRRRGRRGEGGVTLGALNRDGWAEIARANPSLRSTPIPAPVRPTLPALKDENGVLSVPHLGYRRRPEKADTLKVAAVFCFPAQPLAGAGLTVV